MAYHKDAQIILLSISCVVITVINTLCIYVIINSTKLRKKPPTILISNLIGTHMIQGICVLPLNILRTSEITKNTYAEAIVCDGFWFTYMLTFYSATISVFFLGVDRVLAVVLLTSYDNYVNRRNVLRVTILAWTYILALCLLPFLPFTRSKALANSVCHYLQPREWTIFMLIGNGLIPYGFIVIGYIYVHVKLARLSGYFADIDRKDGTPLDKKEQKKREKRKRKFKFHNKITRLTFLVVLTYGLTWIPTMLYYLFQHICTDWFSKEFYKSDLKNLLSFISKYINFFDAIIAPILYCYFHDEFRLEFKRIICREKKATLTTTESNGQSCNNMYADIPF